MTILHGVTYFKENKTNRATHLKLIAQIRNYVTNLGYSFQASSTLCFNIFEISDAAFALGGLTKQVLRPHHKLFQNCKTINPWWFP